MNRQESYKNIVVIDANFLMIPIQYKINFLEELQFQLEGKTLFLLYQQILDELEAKKKRTRNKQKFQHQLKGSLAFLETFKDKFHIEVNPDQRKNKNQTTDAFLLEKCQNLQEQYKKKQIYLATNDYVLRKKARARGINRIYVIKKQYLKIEGSWFNSGDSKFSIDFLISPIFLIFQVLKNGKHNFFLNPIFIFLN